VADLRSKQVELTVDALNEALASDDLDDYQGVLHALAGEDPRRVALAAVKLVHEARGAVLDEQEIPDAWSGSKDERSRGGRADRASGRTSGAGARAHGASSEDTAFVHVNLGREAGVRPADLVGAIANESGLTGRVIGPIRIADRYSVVGVPKAAVDDVVRTMKSTTIRGKKAEVRRYVE